LQRVATGVGELNRFLLASLNDWKEHFSEGIRSDDLIDGETARSAGILLVTFIDQSLLTPDLLQQLKASVPDGVERGHLAARNCFVWVC
jgi:hypothetical protein